MRAELNFTKQKCARFFPELDELAIISREFLARLTKRQDEYGDRPLEKISDILTDFWNSDWGERKAKAYGRLCARQHDSQSYKNTRCPCFPFFAFLGTISYDLLNLKWHLYPGLEVCFRQKRYLDKKISWSKFLENVCDFRKNSKRDVVLR